MSECEQNRLTLLSEHLRLTVPLAIDQLRKRGGPTEDDLDLMRAFADLLAGKGDVLLYGGKTGEAGNLISQLARALAVMAFEPGGVEILGLHFEATPAVEPNAA